MIVTNDTGKVYPRACGGTPRIMQSFAYSRGLSPRVRGNLVLARDVPPFPRSIPARAGEPSSSCSALPLATVYPRACGGTSKSGEVAYRLAGLSPRVRGNHDLSRSLVYSFRSIPARAGEPQIGWADLSIRKVYPRACGGTRDAAHLDIARQGLSPRVRGNPMHQLFGSPTVGSIPARAGEPLTAAEGLILYKVYPRACGGTRASGQC